MRIVCAPDSFKGSMTAPQAAAAMALGVRAVHPDAEVLELPIADGGEGFTDAVAAALNARQVPAEVADQRGTRHITSFAIATDQASGQPFAVLDVAATSGLERLPVAERNPLDYDSRGLGELMLAALDAGATRLVVGIGGSSTSCWPPLASGSSTPTAPNCRPHRRDCARWPGWTRPAWTHAWPRWRWRSPAM